LNFEGNNQLTITIAITTTTATIIIIIIGWHLEVLVPHPYASVGCGV